MRLVKLSITYFLLLSPSLVFSQIDKTKNFFSIGSEIGYGAIFKHSQQIEHLSNANPKTLELHLRYKLNKTEGWQGKLNNPSLCFLISGTNLDNEKVLGNSYNFGAYMGIPILRNEKNLFEFRIGTGLTYATRKFSLEDNRQNNVYSTNFSGLGYTRFSYLRSISPHLDLSAGLGLAHFSNGSYRLPNLGANILSINSGLYYHFQPQGEKNRVNSPKKEIGDSIQYILNFSFGYGAKESFPINSGRHPIYTSMILIERKTQSISSWLGGLDINKNTSLESELRYLSPQAEFKNDLRVAVVGAYSLNLGKFSALGYIGIYLYSPVPPPRFFYSKIGFRYELIKDISFGLNLKAHAGVADFTEYVLTYKL